MDKIFFMSNPAKELLRIMNRWNMRAADHVDLPNVFPPEEYPEFVTTNFHGEPSLHLEKLNQRYKILLSQLIAKYVATPDNDALIDCLTSLMRFEMKANTLESFSKSDIFAVSNLAKESGSTFGIPPLTDSSIDYLRRSFEEILKCVGDAPEKLGSLKYVVWNNAKRGLDCLNSSPIDHLELREICFSFIGSFAALIIIDGGFKEGVDKHFGGAGGIREFFSNFIGHVGLWFSNSTSGAAGNVIAAHLPDIIGLLGG